MLRITRKTNGQVVFKVSGELTAENVSEMEALIAAEVKGKRIVLDCTDLRSVDGRAVRFLEKWEAHSIKLKKLRPLHPRVDQKTAAGTKIC